MAMTGRVARFALSVAGYLVLGGILAWGFSSGKFAIPPGDVLIWDRVGDEVRAGISPYYAVAGSGGFYYAPPWAVLFALVSWVPVQVLALGMIAAEVAALRYIAGSWQRFGYACLFPLVAFELASGQVNLIMAAALVAAVRGDPRAAVVMAAAKLSPILAVRDGWRRAVPILVVMLAVTLPVLGLWAGWVRQLVGTYGQNIAPTAQIPVPFLPRLALALVLVAYGRPWSRVLGAIIATPALYWVSWIMLLALLGHSRGRGHADLEERPTLVRRVVRPGVEQIRGS